MDCNYYLGIGIGGFAHDCAAALFRNGELLATAPEERFTRLKHQGRISWQAIQFCLDWAGIDANDVSVICHSFKRRKMVRYASSKLLGSIRYPRSLLKEASTADKAAQLYWLSLMIFKSETGLHQLRRNSLGVDTILFITMMPMQQLSSSPLLIGMRLY
jgi:predicted NodU family carbamoyl transferase